MKIPNPIASILRIAFMTLLVGLCVWAQSNSGVIIAETSSTASKGEAKSTKAKPSTESSTKTKSASGASDKDSKKETKSETKSEAKATPAPLLASVPETQAKEAKEAKEGSLPFKLNERAELATETPSASGMLLRTFGALIFIVGLIAAAGWTLRYFGIINFGKQQSEAAGLEVLDTVQLGERRSLTIVKFGERTLLIGSTPQGLSLLAEEENEPETPAGAMPPVRTVTDLLDVNVQPQFEQELARASMINTASQINTVWSDRRVQ